MEEKHIELQQNRDAPGALLLQKSMRLQPSLIRQQQQYKPILKHQGQQILLLYQGWLPQEIVHIQRGWKKEESLKDQLKITDRYTIWASLAGNTEAPTEMLQLQSPYKQGCEKLL